MTHQYATSWITGGGHIIDICSCGFKVKYHVSSVREQEVAEQAFRVHVGSVSAPMDYEVD